MTDWSEKTQKLNSLIRPLTFPVAVRLVKSVDEFPAKTRRPSKDIGFKTNVCAGMTFARKYGWTVGITADDNVCRTAAYTYGWSSSEPESEKGMVDFLQAMNYAANPEAAKTMMQHARQLKLKNGEYEGVLFYPLERAVIEPHVILIFCNAAQLMRLVHGATQETGKNVQSVFSGRYGSCTDGVLGVFRTNEAKVILPGNGERVWAMVQDEEMLFVAPAGSLDNIIKGLEATHSSGVRYPIPVDIRHEPNFPSARRA